MDDGNIYHISLTSDALLCCDLQLISLKFVPMLDYGVDLEVTQFNKVG
jgi:hypothetical protein